MRITAESMTIDSVIGVIQSKEADKDRHKR